LHSFSPGTTPCRSRDAALWFRIHLGFAAILQLMDGTALVLAPGLYKTEHAKTAHGLVRGSSRFEIVGVVDPSAAGEDAGVALDGKQRDIPIFSSLSQALAGARKRPNTCVVGVAVAGGSMPPALHTLLLSAAEAGLSIVNGLHQMAADDPAIAAAAQKSGARIVDVRRPRPVHELHFWSGAITQVRAPRIAVLGTDCALGKRTTAQLLVEACGAAGIHAEMIYTGQTGWMQGARYGFVLDATPNDFVSGELEHALVTCEREARPDLMVIEGQSALRNPSGPCGAELVISGQAAGVVLQHAPGRTHFKGHPGWAIPQIDEEIALVVAYGARVLAVTLNGERMTPGALIEAQRELAARLAVPVVRPLEEGMQALVPLVRRYLDSSTASAASAGHSSERRSTC
jgi:uncharacterized NAD-dependent epimerase/dehydratase family protein